MSEGSGVCPYCGQERVLTYEHVVPRSIGGNLVGSPSPTGIVPGNPFKLRACGRCNSACGTWVDGMFTRSWPLHSARFAAATHHIDLEQGVTPLCFMGGTEFRTDGLECDLWLGPTGDSIFHLHEPFPKDYPTVGVPHWLERSTLDAGIVLVYLRASNPQWHGVIARSIQTEFEEAPIFWMNAIVIDPRTGERRTSGLPEKYASLARAIHEKCFLEGNWTVGIEQVHNAYCGHRFLVKLALGFGALFLPPSFVASPDAAHLRSFLWNRTPAAWPDGLTGSPFFTSLDPKFDQLTNWRGCHLFMLHDYEGGVALAVKLYGKYYAGLKIASLDFGLHALGNTSAQLIWIIAPGLRLFSGPMSLSEYTRAYLHPGDDDQLALLRAAIENAPVLPPFDHPDLTATPSGTVTARSEPGAV